MKFIIECIYCGFKETKEYFYKISAKDTKCFRCGDKHVKIKEETSEKIDTYAGSPAFPGDEEDTDNKYDSYL